MRSIKLAGLAAIAALMAVAVIGTTVATAEGTALCAKDQTPCEPENLITHTHEATLTENPALFLNSLGNVKCDVLYLGDVTEIGAPLTLESTFTYSSCFRKKIFGGEEACTVIEKNGPVEIKVLKEGHETGKVTGEGEVEVKCGSVIKCTFNGETLEGTAKGSLLSSETNGSVSLENQKINAVSGTLCPKTAELDITTTPLSPTSLIGTSLRLRRICLEKSFSGGGPLGNNCTSYDSNGNFVLGMVEVNLAVNDMACAYVAFPVGYFLELKAGTSGQECDPMRKHTEPDTIYELGTIR